MDGRPLWTVFKHSMPEDLVHGFKVLGVLGSGSFGQVLLVSRGDQGDERFAVKRIRLNASLPAEYVTAEIANHSRLCHPHGGWRLTG